MAISFLTTLPSRIGQLGLRRHPLFLVTLALASELAMRVLLPGGHGVIACLLTLLVAGAVAPALEDALSPFARRLRPTASTLPALCALGALFLGVLVPLLHALGRLDATETNGLSRLFFETSLLAYLCLVAGERFERAGSPETEPGAESPALFLTTTAALVGGVTATSVSYMTGQSAGASLVTALAILLATDVRLRRELRGFRLGRAKDDLAEHGIRVTYPGTLLDVGHAELFVFRRRGVLTRGRPRVRDVVSVATDRRREEVLRLAAAAEVGAGHPLRSAIVDDADFELGTVPNIEGFEHVPGRGVRASLQGRELCFGNLDLLAERGIDAGEIRKLERAGRPFRERGDTVLSLTLGGRAEGVIALSDGLRPETAIALQEIRDRGARVAVLSKDDPQTVEALCRDLGPVEVLAEVPRPVSERRPRGARRALTLRRKRCWVLVGAPDFELPDGVVSVAWPSERALSAADGGDRSPARAAGPSVWLDDRDLGSLPRLFAAALDLRRRLARATAGIALLHLLAWIVIAGWLVPLPAAARPFLAAALFLAVRGGWARVPCRPDKNGSTGGGARSRGLRLPPVSFQQ